MTIDDEAALNDYIIIQSWYGLDAGALLYYTYQKELGTSKWARCPSTGGTISGSISASYFTASIACRHWLLTPSHARHISKHLIATVAFNFSSSRVFCWNLDTEPATSKTAERASPTWLAHLHHVNCFTILDRCVPLHLTATIADTAACLALRH